MTQSSHLNAPLALPYFNFLYSLGDGKDLSLKLLSVFSLLCTAAVGPAMPSLPKMESCHLVSAMQAYVSLFLC